MRAFIVDTNVASFLFKSDVRTDLNQQIAVGTENVIRELQVGISQDRWVQLRLGFRQFGQ
jgi:predicted nucleic acid-binding protein